MKPAPECSHLSLGCGAEVFHLAPVMQSICLRLHWSAFRPSVLDWPSKTANWNHTEHWDKDLRKDGVWVRTGSTVQICKAWGWRAESVRSKICDLFPVFSNLQQHWRSQFDSSDGGLWHKLSNNWFIRSGAARNDCNMQFSDVTERPCWSIFFLQTEPFWFQRLNVVQPLLLSAKKKSFCGTRQCTCSLKSTNSSL